MKMNKVVGYVVAVVGLVVIALGSGFFGEIDLLGVSSLYISIGGIVLVVIGAMLSVMDGTGRRRQDRSRGRTEVPIYEGVGKKRRIVGYRKD